MKRLLGSALGLGLAVSLLTACGSGNNLDSIDVSTKGDVPSVKVAEGFTTEETETRVISEGDGATLKDGDVAKVNYVAVNGRTGKSFDNSFKTNAYLTVQLSKDSILEGIRKGLTGQKVGSEVLVAIPPKDGFGQPQPSLDVEADDSIVFLFDIVSTVPTEAKGTAKELPSEAPVLEFSDGKPSGFKPGKNSPKNPDKPLRWTPIVGDGDKVEAGQEITAQYIGQVYPDGKVFDSSWTKGAPFTQSLDGLIKCWQDTLVGQTIGSRVIIVCPPATAYGGTDNELAEDTLVFAIDLLDAS